MDNSRDTNPLPRCKILGCQRRVWQGAVVPSRAPGRSSKSIRRADRVPVMINCCRGKTEITRCLSGRSHVENGHHCDTVKFGRGLTGGTRVLLSVRSCASATASPLSFRFQSSCSYHRRCMRARRPTRALPGRPSMLHAWSTAAPPMTSSRVQRCPRLLHTHSCDAFATDPWTDTRARAPTARRSARARCHPDARCHHRWENRGCLAT